ncbi:MAG: hypothetical protein WC097_01670 [Eubacteriales bacterium]
MINLSWEDVEDRLRINVLPLFNKYYLTHIYGIPRGGLYPAIMLKGMAVALGHECGLIETLDGYAKLGVLIIDDIIETGKTMESYSQYFRVAVWNKFEEPTSKWIVFPWERMCGEGPGYSRDKRSMWNEK